MGRATEQGLIPKTSACMALSLEQAPTGQSKQSMSASIMHAGKGSSMSVPPGQALASKVEMLHMSKVIDHGQERERRRCCRAACESLKYTRPEVGTCQKKGRFFKIIFQGIIGYTARPAPGEAIQHDNLTGPLSRGGSSLNLSGSRSAEGQRATCG